MELGYVAAVYTRSVMRVTTSCYVCKQFRTIACYKVDKHRLISVRTQFHILGIDFKLDVLYYLKNILF